MKRELWLFTMYFPYGNGEAFLENELPILAKGFQRVKLFPLLADGAVRPLPPNVEVVKLFSTAEAYRPISLGHLLAALPRAWKVWQMGRGSAPSQAVFNKHKREFRSQLRQALERERLLRQRIAMDYDPARITLYSYWTSDWATVLALWKIRQPDVEFVTRMHGFDLFAERAPDGWQKFQTFHVAQANRIHIASQAGLDDMVSRWPMLTDTFRLARLGTTDHGLGPWWNSEELRVVSCSNFVELKRLPLLVEALSKVLAPVHWTHFGDGPMRTVVERLIKTLPPNVRVDLMGSRPNAEVMNWYMKNPVDVFVHASCTEGGAPVALQEAVSFGIPLVAADAGGVREVVTEASGALLPNDLTADLLGKALNDFRGSRWHTPEARAEVRAFWASRFNAAEVYGRFVEELQEQ